MHNFSDLAGVYAAALTPLKPDYSPDLDAIPHFLHFLAKRGCHGALLLGTTGEGPSFSPQERRMVFQAALSIRQEIPKFRLLGGTGTPSLEETIDITRAAFELGLDGVVVLPPYYYRKATDDGLFLWFAEVLEKSVPTGKALFAYHIPSVSGVSISIDLLSRLKEAFPDRFAGLKDSSGDPDFARLLGQRFGKDLLQMTGNDRLFTLALEAGASGCITAMGNLFSPDLRLVWDAFQNNSLDPAVQQLLSERRAIFDRYPPASSLLKALLARQHDFTLWPVRPPLLPLPSSVVDQAEAEMAAIDLTAR